MNNIIVIVILIFFSALFSGSEISFATSSEYKLKKDKSEIGKITFDIFNRYSEALISILIGNNLVNIASSAIATVILVDLFGDTGAVLSTIIMTLIIVTFGEIAPKIIASNNPEKFAKFVSVPIRVFMYVTYPIVFLVNKMLNIVSKLWINSKTSGEVTEGDLETIIDTVEEEGVIDEDTADLLQNALDFDDVLAYEIITHRLDVEGIDIEDDSDKVVDTIMNTTYSRLPVYKDSLDSIVGYVVTDECLKSIAFEDFDLKKQIHKPLFVPKTTCLDDVLVDMKKKKCHIGVVTDEYGGTMGIITMEDVLEQIVGEIWDENEEIDEEFEEVKKNVYDVQGEMRLEDLFEELNLDYEGIDSDNATVGGWAIEMIGHYPKNGESFEYEDYRFEINEAKDKRVLEVRIFKKIK